MTDPLERRLRWALRPVDPGVDLAQRVLARLPPAPRAARPHRHVLRNPWLWIPTGLAACLATVVAVRHEQLQRIEDAERAREQVLQALQLTNEKIDRAYELVRDRAATQRSSDERQS